MLSQNRTTAASNATTSAATIVRQMAAKLRGAALASERPWRVSSRMRSKYTTYESTVTPTETMMPVAPASVSA